MATVIMLFHPLRFSGCSGECSIIVIAKMLCELSAFSVYMFCVCYIQLVVRADYLSLRYVTGSPSDPVR